MAIDFIDVKKKTGRAHQQAKKMQRRNQLKQVRQNKREELLNERRKIGYDNCPPILIALFNNSGKSIDEFINSLAKCEEDLIIDRSHNGFIFVTVPKFKVKYQFMYPSDDLIYNLDAVKVCDLLLIIHPVDATQDYLLKSNNFMNIYYHCLPPTMHIVCGLEEVNMKQRALVKKHIQNAIDHRFPSEKIHKFDTKTEILQFLQLVCNFKKRKVSLRAYHSLLLADKFEYNETDTSLKVYGYIRYNKLDVNGLIHIPGWTNFQMRSIRLLDDPRPMSNKNHANLQQMDLETDIILRPDPLKQETLEAENERDLMEGEQTWPTPEELAEASDKAKKRIVTVPKGTSDYQAAWMINHEDEDDDASDSPIDSDDEDDYETGEPMTDEDSDDGGVSRKQFAEEEFESLTLGEKPGEGDYDAKMDIEEEEKALRKFREAREDELFPDEIDTPTNIAARQRFARYRGLKSFIHSPWNPKENLPDDYSRIFQFANFQHSRKHIIKKFKNDESTTAPAGSYVEIILEKVPSELVKHYSTELNPPNPLLLVGILPYEQKMSLMNVVLRRTSYSQNEEPIKSKDELIIHLGFRRFTARPIFSSHTNGDKFKFCKFMADTGAHVASFYGPITFSPASATAYIKGKDGSLKLAAIGSVLSVNPDRVIVKRIRLSGHPFKVVGKTAVVRYMFFNREDIKWFQPVELRSKYGRHGHIKEPLGTHGHMKCIFDRPLTSNDTVLMNLYKRVFPKWSYREIVEEDTKSTEMDQ